MRHSTFTILIYLGILIAPVIACSSSEATGNPFLENLLNASDDREFSKALSIYGSLQNEDVPTVAKAAESYSGRRRKNAAMMMNLCRQESCKEIQINIVRKTKDLSVWATLVETAGKTDEAVLRERPDFLTKALASDDPDLLAPALRVGIKVEHDGIQKRIVELLDSKSPKVLEVVINNLSPMIAKQESARLSNMLADEETYGDVEMEIAIALIRGADPNYYPNIRAFINRLKAQKSDHLFFNEATFSEDKQTVDLLWQIVRMKDDDVLAEFRGQAYDALTRRVWAPSLREPATVELMQRTLAYLKTASLDTNPRKHMDDEQYTAKSALYLIAFLNKGNTDNESFIYGKDAVAFTEKWLREHGA
ncbi:hypothetical protein BH10ACI2_BH10ACI2_23920 [soil metagenome]